MSWFKQAIGDTRSVQDEHPSMVLAAAPFETRCSGCGTMIREGASAFVFETSLDTDGVYRDRSETCSRFCRVRAALRKLTRRAS